MPKKRHEKKAQEHHEETYLEATNIAEQKAKMLFSAVLGNSPARVIEAIRSGSDVNYPGPSGKTALHAAAAFENTEIMETLIRAGAKLDALTTAGETPLDVAQTYKKARSIAFLTSDRFFKKPKQAWFDEGIHFVAQRKFSDALNAFRQAIKIDRVYALRTSTVHLLLINIK